MKCLQIHEEESIWIMRPSLPLFESHSHLKMATYSHCKVVYHFETHKLLTYLFQPNGQPWFKITGWIDWNGQAKLSQTATAEKRQVAEPHTLVRKQL